MQGAFTWPEHDLQAVASLSTPVEMPSMSGMDSSPAAAAAAAFAVAAAGGTGTAADVPGGSVDTNELRCARPEPECVVSHGPSSGSVAVLAAAAAQDMLDQMLQLEGMQQQLMDEVIALLPLI